MSGYAAEMQKGTPPFRPALFPPGRFVMVAWL
jgi:hypothetical protein